jgi:hypothetical protein
VRYAPFKVDRRDELNRSVLRLLHRLDLAERLLHHRHRHSFNMRPDAREGDATAADVAPNVVGAHVSR